MMYCFLGGFFNLSQLTCVRSMGWFFASNFSSNIFPINVRLYLVASMLAEQVASIKTKRVESV